MASTKRRRETAARDDRCDGELGPHRTTTLPRGARDPASLHRANPTEGGGRGIPARQAGFGCSRILRLDPRLRRGTSLKASAVAAATAASVPAGRDRTARATAPAVPCRLYPRDREPRGHRHDRPARPGDRRSRCDAAAAHPAAAGRAPPFPPPGLADTRCPCDRDRSRGDRARRLVGLLGGALPSDRGRGRRRRAVARGPRRLERRSLPAPRLGRPRCPRRHGVRQRRPRPRRPRPGARGEHLPRVARRAGSATPVGDAAFDATSPVVALERRIPPGTRVAVTLEPAADTTRPSRPLRLSVVRE